MPMRATLLAGLAMMALSCPSAFAGGAVVHVELQDATGDGGASTMHMILDHASVKAGEVSFRVMNESKTLVHEMLVLPTGQDPTALPYDPKKDVFLEDRVKSLGEVEELQPGKPGELTLTLKPGPYLLACNQPGHFHAGMWAKFTVTP